MSSAAFKANSKTNPGGKLPAGAREVAAPWVSDGTGVSSSFSRASGAGEVHPLACPVGAEAPHSVPLAHGESLACLLPKEAFVATGPDREAGRALPARACGCPHGCQAGRPSPALRVEAAHWLGPGPALSVPYPAACGDFTSHSLWAQCSCPWGVSQGWTQLSTLCWLGLLAC